MRVYVGTYTTGEEQGIYLCEFDEQTGDLTATGHTAAVRNPSFLARHPSGNYLYAVSEVADYQGQHCGSVVAFAIDRATGRLERLNEEGSCGAIPCHLSIDATGQYVLLANYTGGSVAMLPIRDGGTLGAACGFVQHRGSGADKRRQEAPHAHSITIDKSNQYAFACDLGLDRILIYRIDLAEGQLVPSNPASVTIHPGAGPRHFDFHPSDRFAYAINELDSTVTAFAFDRANGALSVIQDITTLPEGWEGTNWPADIHVHPSGRFLYGSNRGHDSIAIYGIDQASGKLTSLGQESTGGKNPRNFALDPSGRFLLAANQDTNNVVSYRLDPETGAMVPTGAVLELPKPVCVLFAPEA